MVSKFSCGEISLHYLFYDFKSDFIRCLINFSDGNNAAELALYSSFDEAVETQCVFCGQSKNDPIYLGKKITVENITAHHFCLVRSLE